MNSKWMIPAAVMALTLALAPQAQARNTEYKLSFEELLNAPEVKEKLDPSIKFYLAGQKTPTVVKRFQDDVSSRKTSGVGKSDEVGCRWAALSALLAMQQKAKQVGANAVVDVVSYYKKAPFSSPTEYQCNAGAVVIGVTLKGTYATVAE